MLHLRFIVKILVSVSIAAPTLPAWGAEHYRPVVPGRELGASQGPVGSCEAESQVSALESAFAYRGYPIRLSRYYQHAALRASGAIEPIHRLEFKPEDHQLIERIGPILPDYMWPENDQGIDLYATGNRPRISVASVVDPAFISARAMGYSDTYFSFLKKFSNSRTLTDLKNEVTIGKAVTLSLCPELLQYSPFDERTGLVRAPTESFKITEKLESCRSGGGSNHAVSVTGYDDALYPELTPPGAFIIRNSWNTCTLIQNAANASKNQDLGPDLAKFRSKIGPQNLPGFYALPYAFIQAQADANIGGFRVLDLDYQAFAQQYEALKLNYKVKFVPFACSVVGARQQNTPAFHARNKIQRFSKDMKKLWSTAESLFPSLWDISGEIERLHQVALDESSPLCRSHFRKDFSFATLTSHEALGIDQAKDLYEGKFLGYYCPHTLEPEAIVGTGLWPTLKHYEDEKVKEAIRGLSFFPYDAIQWQHYLKALSEVEAKE